VRTNGAERSILTLKLISFTLTYLSVLMSDFADFIKIGAEFLVSIRLTPLGVEIMASPSHAGF